MDIAGLASPRTVPSETGRLLHRANDPSAARPAPADVLERIWVGEIDEAAGAALIVATAGAPDVLAAAAALCLSEAESAAWLHGATLERVARFRYEGWPSACARCAARIVPERFGWTRAPDGGGVALVHLDCGPGRPGRAAPTGA